MPPTGPRGRYAKGVRTREAIIDAALQLASESRSGAPSSRAIAQAVGLSEKGLGHYFATREELLVAIILERDSLDDIEVGDDEHWLQSLAERMARRNAARRGLVRLFLELVLAAGDPADPGHEVFVQRYDRLSARMGARFEAEGDDPEQARWRARLVVGIRVRVRERRGYERRCWFAREGLAQLGERLDLFEQVLPLEERVLRTQEADRAAEGVDLRQR